MTALPVRCPTLPEVSAAVDALPEGVRAQLRLGPMGGHTWCRLCSALRDVGTEFEVDEESPAGVLWRWHESHEVLRARGATDTLVTGEVLTEERLEESERAYHALRDAAPPIGRNVRRLAEAVSYYRCLTVYLLAGWRPGPPVGEYRGLPPVEAFGS